MSYAGVARRSMYREAAYGDCRRERCRCQRCCREYGLRERCCGPGCSRKCCCCAGSGGSTLRLPLPPPSKLPLPLPIGTMVPSLPPGCTSTVIGGVNYFNCGGVYYRAGFQGNNIVYIVSAP